MGGGARPSRQRSACAKACISRPVVIMGQKDGDSGARERNHMELERFAGLDRTTLQGAILVRMIVSGLGPSSKVLELTALCLITRLLGQVTPCSPGTRSHPPPIFFCPPGSPPSPNFSRTQISSALSEFGYVQTNQSDCIVSYGHLMAAESQQTWPLRQALGWASLSFTLWELES